MQTGNHVRDDVVAMLIELISSCEELHQYSVCQLWMQLTDDLSLKQPVLQVCMWTIGEFADQLVSVSGSDQLAGQVITENDIVERCEEILNSVHMSLITKQYTLNALTKLSVRFPDQSERVKQVVDLFGCSHSVELQQRAVEFGTIFSRHDTLRDKVWEKMPSMVRVDRKIENNDIPEETSTQQTALLDTSTAEEAKPEGEGNNVSALLDLLDLLG